MNIYNKNDLLNENEIKENCELYLNNKKIDFSYKYKIL